MCCKDSYNLNHTRDLNIFFCGQSGRRIAQPLCSPQKGSIRWRGPSRPHSFSRKWTSAVTTAAREISASTTKMISPFRNYPAVFFWSPGSSASVAVYHRIWLFYLFSLNVDGCAILGTPAGWLSRWWRCLSTSWQPSKCYQRPIQLDQLTHFWSSSKELLSHSSLLVIPSSLSSATWQYPVICGKIKMEFQTNCL